MLFLGLFRIKLGNMGNILIVLQGTGARLLNESCQFSSEKWLEEVSSNFFTCQIYSLCFRKRKMCFVTFVLIPAVFWNCGIISKFEHRYQAIQCVFPSQDQKTKHELNLIGGANSFWSSYCRYALCRYWDVARSDFQTACPDTWP